MDQELEAEQEKVQSQLKNKSTEEKMDLETTEVTQSSIEELESNIERSMFCIITG